MSETSIRDVFLSMQLPPVDELVATSKTDFRTIRKSRRSCYRTYHAPKTDESSDTTPVLLDELINTIQRKNIALKEHLEQENQIIGDLTCKKREIDLWRQLTNLVLLPSTRKNDQLIVYDLSEKKTLEFHGDTAEKVWNHLARHLTDDFINHILHDSTPHSSNASTGHHAIKKARRTNDTAQKIRPSTSKATNNLASKTKRTTRRSRM